LTFNNLAFEVVKHTTQTHAPNINYKCLLSQKNPNGYQVINEHTKIQKNMENAFELLTHTHTHTHTHTNSLYFCDVEGSTKDKMNLNTKKTWLTFK
jgi:hypothetical protein